MRESLVRISKFSSRNIVARCTHATRTVSRWHSHDQNRLRIQPWFAKSVRDSRRALIVFWDRKSVMTALRLFDSPTSTQKAGTSIPIWASEFKVHTFGDAEAFWAYVDTQAKEQGDVNSVREAMNDAKDTRVRVQFQRVEDQFAKAKRNLEDETQNVKKTVAQVTSVRIYTISRIQTSYTLYKNIYRNHSATRPRRKSESSRCF